MVFGAIAILAVSAAAAFAAPVLQPGVTSAPGMSGVCTDCHTYATTPPVVTPPVVTPPVVDPPVVTPPVVTPPVAGDNQENDGDHHDGAKTVTHKKHHRHHHHGGRD